MNQLSTRFILPEKTIKRAFRFARRISTQDAQSSRDFGSESGRNRTDFIADTVEGKLAEEAFRLFLEKNFGISASVDYDIYPDRNTTDYGNDLSQIVIGGQSRVGILKADIKSARPYSHWLLVEDHKFRGANLYILVTIDGLSNDWEKSATITGKVTATICGFAYYTDFLHRSNRPWFEFERGKPLIRANDARMIIEGLRKRRQLNPDGIRQVSARMIKAGRIQPLNVNLKAKRSYGIPKEWLRNGDEWQDVVRLLSMGALDPQNQILYKQVKRWQK